MTTTTKGCGTYAGASAHKRRGEYLCDACRDANATYQREYRIRTGNSERKWEELALAELRRRHRSEYLRIKAAIKETPRQEAS